jgi:hypothetical protein
LWADIGVLAGMAICVWLDRYPVAAANPVAISAIFIVLVVAALTTRIAISNRQDAERRALKRPIANACIGLYAVSFELQRFLSTLQYVAQNDNNGRSSDLTALCEAAASVSRAAAALAPSSVLGSADVSLVLQTGRSVAADTGESVAAACQALDLTLCERRERWTAAIKLTTDSLSRIGKTVGALQSHR